MLKITRCIAVECPLDSTLHIHRVANTPYCSWTGYIPLLATPLKQNMISLSSTSLNRNRTSSVQARTKPRPTGGWIHDDTTKSIEARCDAGPKPNPNVGKGPRRYTAWTLHRSSDVSKLTPSKRFRCVEYSKSFSIWCGSWCSVTSPGTKLQDFIGTIKGGSTLGQQCHVANFQSWILSRTTHSMDT